QSPQMFKQILMISGLDRYFQIARCFRDEDLRADRQPEFTQIDLEMTFPQQETIFRMVEGFLTAAFREAGVTLSTPFLQMTYDDAIRRFGSDKPDMRLPELTDVRSEFEPSDLESLKIEPGLPILAVVLPGKQAMSNTQKKAFIREVEADLGPDLAYLDVERLAGSAQYAALAGKLDGAAAKNCGLEKVEPDNRLVVITPRVGTKKLKDDSWIYKKVGQLRLDLAKRFREEHGAFEKKGTAEDYKFLWVTDFPFFEWDETTHSWTFAHHPFTSPHEDDLKAGRMESDPGAVRALAYDIVLNGIELGSGSIRIHRQDIQQQIFQSLGMSAEEAKERFGFFLEALEYGTPPHGGIALGLDRIVMILAGAQSLREVIAFPKTAKAIDMMVDAPSPVSETQLKELHIQQRRS
ncbi:MAG: aspartate--tRNA ligase, partial [Acidobacteriaceae bacterium]